MRLDGFVASPSHSRANPRMQYLFLNGRAIRDRSLQHALGEAYRGLLLTGRYPIAFLRIDMPAEMVDVNVHPTKLEVRFQESGRLYSQLLGTLRTRFLTTDLTRPACSRCAEHEAAVGHRSGSKPTPCGANWSIGPRGSCAEFGRRTAGQRVAKRCNRDSMITAAAMPQAPLELSTLDRRWEAVGAGIGGELRTNETASNDAAEPTRRSGPIAWTAGRSSRLSRPARRRCSCTIAI